jgi:GNAT acetyltransferase
MLTRLEENRYAEIREQYREIISQFPLINAVVSKLQKGFVYVDPVSNCSFVSTKSGFSLFVPAGPAGLGDDLLDVLKNCDDLPNYIHIYSPAQSLADYFKKHSNQCRIRRRAQFRRQDTAIGRSYENLLPSGYRIATIQDVGFDRLEKAFKLDFGGRYWNSREEFLSGAIGACILNEKNDPAAVCYSACVIEGVAEMDTLVLPEYRGRKFMRIVSEPFFNLATAQKATPHWDTLVSNKASYIMAQKFGLQLLREYDLLSVVIR